MWWIKFRLSDGVPVLSGRAANAVKAQGQADGDHGVIVLDVDPKSNVEGKVGIDLDIVAASLERLHGISFAGLTLPEMAAAI